MTTSLKAGVTSCKDCLKKDSCRVPCEGIEKLLPSPYIGEKFYFDYPKESARVYSEQDYLSKTNYLTDEVNLPDYIIKEIREQAEKDKIYLSPRWGKRADVEEKPSSRFKTILLAALNRVKLTDKEKALLKVLLPDFIPCQGKRDLPPCEDCLTCQKVERKKNAGCECHTFTHLNFFTGGGIPKLEFRDWVRYFSVKEKPKGNANDISYIEGLINTNPFRKGKRKKPIIYNSNWTTNGEQEDDDLTPLNCTNV